MKRVFIVHGYGGYSDKNWFPWLKTELENAGVPVVIPDMPNTNAPELSKWLPYLQKVVGKVDENTYFVGHSLGCSTILRLLEKLVTGQQAGGAVLVAAFAETIHFAELDSFTVQPWNDEQIRQAVKQIVIINSDNDPHVPLEMGERMRDRFNAKLVVMHNAKHINEKAGFTEVPIIYEELSNIITGENSI